MNCNKIKIVLLNRQPAIGQVSIERVFRTITSQLINDFMITMISVPQSGVSIHSIIRNLLFSSKIHADIVHVTGDIHYCLFAPRKCKKILTIHDLGGYHKVRAQGGIRSFIMWLLWGYIPLKIADRVTCISRFTYEQVLNDFPWVANKLSIIYDPLPLGFNFIPTANNVGKPVLLHLGTKTNKNLERLIEALHGFSCHLRIIGRLTTLQCSLLNKYQIDYSNDYNLTDQQIIDEYKRCSILCFISTMEGFGMPIIEAQAIGRPVITSNLAPMKDIANGAALLVNPYDIQSIRDGIERLCSNSPLRSELIRLGLNNTTQFHAKHIADQYSKIYNEVIFANMSNR